MEPVTTEPTPSGLGSDQLLDGRYRAAEEIGRGAMGVVYVAEHTRLAKRVAIKVLHADLAEDQEACERFELEARAASRVGSPHIVAVLDAGMLQDGRRFLVMEYLRGETFKAWLEREGPVSPERLAPLVLQLCEGLAAAHDQGIVHRDVKPDNLFLVKRTGEGPLLKILDFGVSKFRDHGTDALRSRTGVVLGTPHYMAPEQARGEREVDRRADLYSVGIVMYQALVGERPFAAENVNQLLFRVALEDVPRVDHVPAAFADIVAKATARDPERRYASARLLARDLKRFLEGDAPAPAIASVPSTAPASVPSTAPAVDLDAPTVGDEEPKATTVAPPPSAARGTWWAAGAAAVALAVVAAVVISGAGAEDAPIPTTEATAQATAEATAEATVAPSPEPSAPSSEPIASAAAEAPEASSRPAATAPSSRVAPRIVTPPASESPPKPPRAKTPRPIREDL